jgi:hypothetical protein
LVGVDSTGRYVDISNLKPGQSATLRLIGFSNDGTVTILAGANFTTNAPSSVATINGAGVTGVAASNSDYTVTATYRGNTYTARLGVRNNLATVRGTVKNDAGQNASNVVVEFFDANLRQVGSSRVDADGSFSESVPVTAETFAVITDGAAGYSNIFRHEGIDYIGTLRGCYAPLPNLTQGGTVNVGTVIFFRKAGGSPPPPPTGCKFEEADPRVRSSILGGP